MSYPLIGGMCIFFVMACTHGCAIFCEGPFKQEFNNHGMGWVITSPQNPNFS